MTGEDLTGTFTEQKGAVRSFRMLRDAAAAHNAVLITAEPFLGSAPRVWRPLGVAVNTAAAHGPGRKPAAPGASGRRSRRRRVTRAVEAENALRRLTTNLNKGKLPNQVRWRSR